MKKLKTKAEIKAQLVHERNELKHVENQIQGSLQYHTEECIRSGIIFKNSTAGLDVCYLEQMLQKKAIIIANINTLTWVLGNES